MAVKHTTWPIISTPQKEEVIVPVKPKKNKKVVKKEVVIEPTPVVEEITIEDVLTALEKKSQ